MRRGLRDRSAPAAALLIALLAPPAFAFDEIPPAAIPTLAREAKTLGEFALAGWTVEAKASGDLDGDGKADAALVLHGTDPKLVLRNADGLGPDELDTNPRILAVALATETGFRLAVQNATLIPRRQEPTIADPFSPDGELAIARGAVRVAISYFASAGGWGTADVAFTFRLGDGTLRLIGYDRTDIQRNSGEMEKVSVNYLSGRRSDAKGRIDDDPKRLKTVWSAAPAGAGPTIEAIGDGLEFDPSK